MYVLCVRKDFSYANAYLLVMFYNGIQIPTCLLCVKTKKLHKQNKIKKYEYVVFIYLIESKSKNG